MRLNAFAVVAVVLSGCTNLASEGPQGERGEAGPMGPSGPKGPPGSDCTGELGFYIGETQTDGTTKAEAYCEAGDVALNGWAESDGDLRCAPLMSDETPVGWKCYVDGPQTLVIVRVLCAEVDNAR